MNLKIGAKVSGENRMREEIQVRSSWFLKMGISFGLIPVLILFSFIFLNPNANGTPFATPRPTPVRHFNWPLLEKDKVILVELKQQLSPVERESIFKKMAKMGVLKNISGSEGWNIKVTNGMSAKNAYENLKTDPAVSFAEPVIVTNPENFFATPLPTATHKPYPTPNWKKMVPGKDYIESQILVGLKPNISSSDKERVIGTMASIGVVKHIVLDALKMDFYKVNITNGMSVKDAIEKMKADPAVDYVEPNGRRHQIM